MFRANFRLGLVAISASGLAAAAGCSSAPVAQRVEPHFRVGGGEATTAVVFSDPAVAASLAEGLEMARLDGSLSPRDATAQLAIDDWPEPGRPSLQHPRRVNFGDRADVFLYFERESDHHRHFRRPWW